MVKISELTSLSAVATDDLVPVVDASAGETKQVELSDLASAFRGSYASLPVFNIADYGADPRTATAAAAAAASAAGGGIVHFPSDVEFVGATLPMSGLTDVTFTSAPGVTITTTADASVFLVTNSIRIRFDGLQITGDADVAKTSQTGIVVHTTSSDITVVNCRISGMGYDGVHVLSGTDNVLIAHNLIENCQDDGINPGGTTGGGTSYSKVIGNHVRDSGADGIHISDGSIGTAVVGNTIEGCDKGISVYRCVDVSITGNIVRDSVSMGIAIAQIGVTDLVISNNIVDGGSQGIRLAFDLVNVAVTGNIVKNNTAYGVVVSMSADTRVNAIIAQNVVETTTGATAHILIAKGSDVMVTDNRLSGIAVNSILSNAAGSSHLSIEDNQIDASALSSYSIQCVGVGFAHLTIEGNSISGGSRGLYVSGPTHLAIRDNRILNSTDFGIVLSASSLVSTGGIVSDNLIIGGCSSDGILLGNYSKISTCGNRIIGITGNAIRAASGTIDCLYANNMTNTALGVLGTGATSANNVVVA